MFNEGQQHNNSLDSTFKRCLRLQLRAISFRSRADAVDRDVTAAAAGRLLLLADGRMDGRMRRRKTAASDGRSEVAMSDVDQS